MVSIARRHAEIVAGGSIGQGEYGDKAVFYGLLARVLEHVVEQDPRLPKGAPSFEALGNRVEQTMLPLLRQGIQQLDPQSQNALDHSYRRHTTQAFGQESKYPVERRLMNGVTTYLDVELTTLRTIAKRGQEGQTVSEKGVYTSQRIPFAFALGHITDLRLIPDMVEEWKDSEGSMADVFTEDAARLDPKHGLVFRERPAFGSLAAVTKTPLAGTAHIGCPITMVEHGVATFHNMLAQAAIESDLIHPTAA